MDYYADESDEILKNIWEEFDKKIIKDPMIVKKLTKELSKNVFSGLPEISDYYRLYTNMKRELISQDDILNLKIDLENCKDVLEFINE